MLQSEKKNQGVYMISATSEDIEYKKFSQTLSYKHDLGHVGSEHNPQYTVQVQSWVNMTIPDPILHSSGDPFYWHGLIWIPAWISNHLPGKMWYEIAYHSQTSTVTQLKFGNGKIISFHILLGMGLLIHARIKGNPC